MRLLLGVLFTFALAAAIGLGATWFSSSRGYGLGEVTIGPWTASPKIGSVAIDPFARAALARSGELPLGSGDGIAFVARTDEMGKPLDGRCDISVSGITPLARYWTITLYDDAGRLAPNAVGRHGFTSAEAVRGPDGSFTILIAARPRPGNWLPTGGIERLRLVLRLYDTAVGIATHVGRETTMPSIRTEACT